MKKKRVFATALGVVMLAGSILPSVGTLRTAAAAEETAAPVVTALPGTDSTESAYNSSFLSLTGFAVGHVNDRTKYIGTEYYRVANSEEEFLKALDDAANGSVKVIELTADLDLGWNVLSKTEQAYNCISAYGWEASVEVLNPTIRETGVSQLTISNTNGLTIFSQAGNTVKHAEWKLQGSSSDIIIRNLKLDEMWNWSEKASTKELGWSLLKINGAKGVWIDHCTFTLGSDGNVDSENGASNMTESWNVYSLPADQDPGTDSMLYKTIKYLEYRRMQGTLSDGGRYTKLRTGGATEEQIMAYEAYHQKLCLNGSGDKDFMDGYDKDGNCLEDGNQRLRLTMAFNKVNNAGARFPWVRQGTAHLINCYVDDSGHMALHNDPELPFGEYGGWNLNCSLDAHDGACIGADTCVFNEVRVLVGEEKQKDNEIYDSSVYPDGYCYAGMQVPFNYSFAGVYNHMLAVNSRVTLNGETYVGSSWDNNGDNLFTTEYTWDDKSTIGDFKWYSHIENTENYRKGEAPSVTNPDGSITFIPFTFTYEEELGYSYQKLPLDAVEETVDTYAGAYALAEGPEFWLRTSYGADESIAPVDRTKAVKAEAIRMDQEEMTVKIGDARQLSAWPEPSTVTEKELTWISSDETVAEITDSGLVIPKQAGTAVITAATKDGTNLQKTCMVTVEVGVTKITISAPAKTLYLGDETHPADAVRLTAVISPENATNPAVEWLSSNESVLEIDENGAITLKKAGSSMVTCTSVSDPSVMVSVRITVKEGVNPNPTVEPTATPEATETPAPTETAVLYGDADGSGKVEAADALQVLKAVVKLITLDAAGEEAADVNNDDSVTAEDALLILKKVVRLIDKFPAEQ